MADQYYAIKTRDSAAVYKILAKESGIELGGINVLQEEMRKGTLIFIVLGGDKPAWDTGLIGIGTVSEEPYDIGYSKRNYKIKIDMKAVMGSPIKRDALIPYKDCYGIIAIGPQLKGEPNQALTTMTVTQGVALMRAMTELCPDILDDIKELADETLKQQIFGPVNKMVEIPFNYGEDEKDAITRYLSSDKSEEDVLPEGRTESEPENTVKTKNCLSIQRNPRADAVHPFNFIIYGAPGTGKTYSTAEYALAIIENRDVDARKKTASERKAVIKKYNSYLEKGQIVFTTFHQSYGYEEFIQGLRPDTEAGGISFKTVDGTFKKIADTALNDPVNNYVIIIDEINRANISKVFGELITLIEEDKRWGEINETCATLQSGDIFAVPNNLYIVGTMNSADKSISLIDAALRRRFEFIEQRPDALLVEDLVLRGVLEKLNSLLADMLESSDLLIGHSYFMGRDKGALCTIMNNSIIPLLYEYFYDNKKKVSSVLGECLKGLDLEIKDDKISRIYVAKAEKSV